AHRARVDGWGGGRGRRADAPARALPSAGRGAPAAQRLRRGEDDPLRARGEGGGSPRAAPLRPVPPRLAARRSLPARGGTGAARPARAVGRGVGRHRRAPARSRGEDLAARSGGALLLASPRGPADGAPEVAGGGRGRPGGGGGLPVALGGRRAARRALGGAVQPDPERGRRARPVLPGGGPPVARQPRPPRGRARPRDGGRVAGGRGGAELLRPRRGGVGAGGDGLALRERLRAHLPGLGPAGDLAGAPRAGADVGGLAARARRRNGRRRARIRGIRLRAPGGRANVTYSQSIPARARRVPGHGA